MHEYAYKTQERQRWVIAIFCISVVLSALLEPFGDLISRIGLDPFLKSIQLPHWITVLLRGSTPIAIYGSIYLAFSRRIWRSEFLRSRGAVNLPDLSGEWRGHITTSYGNQSRISVCVTIRQNWDKLSVKLKTAESSSRSFMGAIYCDGGADCVLYYMYKNEPKLFVRDTMHEHGGTARLHIEDDKLHGDYYTGRDRLTQGELLLRR